MPHTIDLDALLNWIDEGETSLVTCAASTKENKSLDVRLRGGYVVRHNNAVVYEGLDAKTAVETYNAISSN